MLRRSRLILAYGFLVGLPLLILFGILDTGRALVAPPAIAGEWTIALEGTPAATKCAGPLRTVPQALNISQSGTGVVITLNDAEKTRLTGVLEGDHLLGSTDRLKASGCDNAPALHIDARVIGKRDQRWLQGRFSLSECDSCGTLPFHATRQRRPVGQGK